MELLLKFQKNQLARLQNRSAEENPSVLGKNEAQVEESPSADKKRGGQMAASFYFIYKIL